MSFFQDVLKNKPRRVKRNSERLYFLRYGLTSLAEKKGFRTARFLFALIYSFLFLFGAELHFHARMGCDSCPAQEFVVFRISDGAPSIGRDDFCDQCRHRDDFCPACHFFSVFRFFTTVALAFLAFTLFKRRLWNDEQRVVPRHRVFLRRSREPPQFSVL